MITRELFDYRLVHFLFFLYIFIFPCVFIFDMFCILFLRSETKRSTEWRHNTILADEAVECLESGEQREYDRGFQ